MICPNCGRELADGEVCTCTQTSQIPEQNAQQETQYEAPQYEAPQYTQPQGNYYDPNAQVPPTYYPPVAENPVPRTDYPAGYKIKKKYVAVILAYTLGILGIHNFYLGNNSKGIAQILLTTVGALILVGPIITLVWSIVEAVLLLTESIDSDANGFKIQTLEEALNSKKD
jgi:TM2 domain-containing membrane protein YozV